MSSHQLLKPLFQQYAAPHPLDIRVGIIGVGKVGMTLALALYRMDLLAWVVARSPAKRSELRTAFDELPVFDTVENVIALPDVVIICTGDSVIEAVASELAEVHSTQLAGKYVLHCSGALNADVLQPCLDAGAHTVAAHPFETFAYSHERLLSGIAWGIECAPDDENFIKNFVMMLGGSPVILPAQARENKSLYHITAVIASNYLDAVIASARDAANAASIQSNIFLPPIIRTAVESALMNLAHNGAPPLTGPIARGDLATLDQHLLALHSQPSLLKQYCYLGLATNEFALREKYISAEIYQEIKLKLEEAVCL